MFIGKKSLTKISIVFITVLIFILIPTLTKSEISGSQLRIENPTIQGNFWSKKVVVYNNENKHYYNVLVSTDIPENLIDVELYRYIISDLKMKVTSNPSYNLQFLDSNGNGLFDTVKWIVPELSEVSFSVEGKLTGSIPPFLQYKEQTNNNTQSSKEVKTESEQNLLNHSINSKNSVYRGSYWERNCVDKTCTITIYSTNTFIQDLNGNWKRFGEIAGINFQNNLLNISWNDKNIILQPYIIYNGVYIDNFTSQYNFTIPYVNSLDYIELKPKIKFVNGLTEVGFKKLTWSNDEIVVHFEDLLKNNFDVTENNTHISVQNISGKVNQNP
jgi:hypothetical protein